ncbi:hypothetical protein B0T14DRAFT_530850 [Immersiella caudata]|uniref:Uncharacterized protein n=1 Tax=Immersiella caudata TaxID=314043 RepID=A0AA39U5U2_9PEZI|nr:hypothetical protein B0T14DRAFT_530850 [Immersiella caudata]
MWLWCLGRRPSWHLGLELSSILSSCGSTDGAPTFLSHAVPEMVLVGVLGAPRVLGLFRVDLTIVGRCQGELVVISIKGEVGSARHRLTKICPIFSIRRLQQDIDAGKTKSFGTSRPGISGWARSSTEWAHQRRPKCLRVCGPKKRSYPSQAHVYGALHRASASLGLPLWDRARGVLLPEEPRGFRFQRQRECCFQLPQ